MGEKRKCPLSESSIEDGAYIGPSDTLRIDRCERQRSGDVTEQQFLLKRCGLRNVFKQLIEFTLSRDVTAKEKEKK